MDHSHVPRWRVDLDVAVSFFFHPKSVTSLFRVGPEHRGYRRYDLSLEGSFCSV